VLEQAANKNATDATAIRTPNFVCTDFSSIPKATTLWVVREQPRTVCVIS
jgi:hypothetical protein